MAEQADGGRRGTRRGSGTGRTTRNRAAGGRSATTRTGGTAASRAATARVAGKAGDVTHPERSVVKDPPPAPDYPRWRVEPGTRIRLADIDPDESERYQRKKDVADELKHHRDRIADLQARLYGEQKRSLLIVLRPWTPAARTAPSRASSPASTPRAARCGRSRPPRTRRRPTTSCGATTRRPRPRA